MCNVVMTDPFQAYTASFKDRKPRLETLKNDIDNFLVLYPKWDDVTEVLGPDWKQDVETSYVTNAKTAEKEIKIVEKPWMVNEISDNYTLCRLAYEAYKKNYTLLAAACGAEMNDLMDFDEFYETLQSNDKNKTTQDYITNIYLHYAMMLIPEFADVAYDYDSDDSNLWDLESDDSNLGDLPTCVVPALPKLSVSTTI
mgnify:CR=1 FL=1